MVLFPSSAERHDVHAGRAQHAGLEGDQGTAAALALVQQDMSVQGMVAEHQPHQNDVDHAVAVSHQGLRGGGDGGD